MVNHKVNLAQKDAAYSKDLGTSESLLPQTSAISLQTQTIPTGR